MAQMRFFFMLLLPFLVSGCLPPQGLTSKAPLISEGELIVYLQPLPQETHNLRFFIESIAAIRDDGTELFVPLAFNEVQGAELAGRQKFLAAGILQPGSYRGLSLRIKKAFVQSEEGEIALFVQEDPFTAKGLFEIKRQRALTLFLTVDGSTPIRSGIRFTPQIILERPGKVLINLRGFVTISDSNLISVFDKKTMLVVDTIATGRDPRGIALDQKRARVYAAILGDDTVAVYDAFTSEIIGKIKLNLGDEPIDLALTSDGKALLSVNHGSNTLSIIDAISMFEIARVRVGEGPNSVVVDPYGFKAYVMNTLSGSISVVDLTQRTFSAIIGVEGSPLQSAFDREGDSLYVITSDTPNLTVIDPSALRVTNKIFIGTGAISIKVDLRTGLLFVGKKFGREITVVDPATSIFVDIIEMGGKAGFMTIDGQENTLFVSVPDKRIVQKLNLTSKKIMAEIEVGGAPYEVSVLGER